MATQLESTFTSVPPAPAPHIRVAFVAGEAVQAMDAEPSTLSPAAQFSTLDELTLLEAVEDIASTAREHLSPPIADLLLRWLEVGSIFQTHMDDYTDEESEHQCSLSCAALKALVRAPSVTLQDVLLKSHLLSVDVSDHGGMFGHRSDLNGDGSMMQAISAAVGPDLIEHSPVATKLQKLSDLAWSMSDRTTGWAPHVGALIPHGFATMRLGSHPDAKLLDAYATYRENLALSLDATDSEVEEAADERMIEVEPTILYERATTIAGALAKLRVAFQRNIQDGWPIYAVTDPSDPTFVRGLETSDMFERMAWSAIEDLAAIGGVDLASHGTTPALQGDRHAAWLTERNEAMIVANSLEDPDSLDDMRLNRINELETHLLESAPVTSEDVIAQLVTAIQLAAEGNEIDEKVAASLVKNAIEVTGIGSLATIGSQVLA